MTVIHIYKENESLFLKCHLPGWCVPGYLNCTLHDECGELRNHQVHTFKAGLFEFEDLLFDNRLESQVRGEEPRSERSLGRLNLVKEVERQQEAGIEERKIEKRGKGKKRK